MGSRKPTFAIRSFFQRQLSGAMRELVLSAMNGHRLNKENALLDGWCM